MGASLDEVKWNKIPYEDASAFPNGVSDWRKYQSQDEDLYELNRADRDPNRGTPQASTTNNVGKGDAHLSEADGTLTLWGMEGEYTTQQKVYEGKADSKETTYACGGITTQGTFSFQYGYVEVKARFDNVYGVWPAIWMKPNDNPWPDNGEIDIMEHLNWDQKVYQTLHFNPSAEADGQDFTGGTAPSVQPKLSGDERFDWHTYGMLWEEGSISFYLDGTLTCTFTADMYEDWPFDLRGEDHEFYLLIDQQIGGSWVKQNDINGIFADLDTQPAAFDIDYVRVYSTENYMFVVPEPSSAVLSLLALAGLAARRRRK